MDAAAESGPVIRLLAHYHARLLATPKLCAQLERLGVATRATIAEHRPGFVDRTAQLALLPRSPRDAAVMRTAWITEGYLLPNGRERLRGCLVVPLPGTSTAIGARSKSRTGHPIWELVAPSGAPDALLFTPPPAAHARELVCTLDPLDALMLCRHGADWVASCARVPDAHGRARLIEHLLTVSSGPLRVIAAGTRDGRALVGELLAAARDRPIRIVHLPAGCSVRDLRRLHGEQAIEALLSDRRLPTSAAAVRSPSGRTRVVRPVAPWAGRAGSLVSALDAHLAHLEAAGRPPDAIRQRTRALDLLRTACLAQKVESIGALTVETLEAFQRSLLSGETSTPVSRIIGAPGPPRSRNAIIRVLSAARQFLAWALRAGLVTRDLRDGLLPLRRTAVTPPQVLSADEVEAILDATRVRTTAGLRDRAMLEVLYSTGIRRVELVGLDVHDLDESRGVLRVRRGKGGTTRLVPLGRRARYWVARYVETARIRQAESAHEPALFLTGRGRRITPKMVTGRMRQCLRTAGIGKAGSCHIFRHSMATLMHDAGADIRDLQALLGHALLTSTQLYTRVSMQRLVAVHARTHPAECGAASIEPE